METSETITKNQNKKESTKEPSDELRHAIQNAAYGLSYLEKAIALGEKEGFPRLLIGSWIRQALKGRGLDDRAISSMLPESIKDTRGRNKQKNVMVTIGNDEDKNQPEQEEVKIKDNTTANLTEEQEKKKEDEIKVNLAELEKPFTEGNPSLSTDNTTIGSPSEHKGLIDQVNELTKQNNELNAENQNLKSIVIEKNKTIDRLNEIVIEKNKTIDRLNDTIQKLDTQIQYLKDQNKNMEKVDVNVVRADNNKPPQPQPKPEVKQQQQTTEQDNDGKGEFDQEKEKARLEKLLEAKETEFLGYKGAKVGRIALSSDIRDLKDRISMLSRKK